MNALKTKLARVVVCSLLLGVAPPAWAGAFDVETKLTASDAAAGDWFGWSVAISGNTAIVGAPGDSDAGTSSGSAYLFDTTTGNQLFKLTASDAAAGDIFFGSSVGISAGTAIVGAFWDDDAADYSGSAYLFDVATGKQLFKLHGSDAAPVGDRFGSSVGISAGTAIVGASYNHDAVGGLAYLFDVTTGKPLLVLTPSDAAPVDRFGPSVAISGNRAIIGTRYDDDAGSGSGSAYLFDTTTGNQLFKLTASDAAAGDYFGDSVAIRAGTAIVTAPFDPDLTRDTGSPYLFDVTTGNQLFKLTASDAAAVNSIGFGYSVGISGGTAIVGASGDDDAGLSSGSAYLFDTTTGNQLFKLTASDAAAGDFFGWSVAISGGTAIVGAIGVGDAGFDSGSAYLFRSGPSTQGDLDLDGDVDDRDLNLLLSEYGTTYFRVDLDALLSNFGRNDMPISLVRNSLSVPEPSGFLLAAFGLLSLVAYAGRRRAT